MILISKKIHSKFNIGKLSNLLESLNLKRLGVRIRMCERRNEFYYDVTIVYEINKNDNELSCYYRSGEKDGLTIVEPRLTIIYWDGGENFNEFSHEKIEFSTAQTVKRYYLNYENVENYLTKLLSDLDQII